MRTILHCDCNGFFASVEALDNPELKNIPMAVGGSVESRKGIILAKNEPAKKYGIVTAETIWSAKKKCPNLIVVPPRHDRYSEISCKVNEIYKEYTEFVEPFGIDESWLDVTDVYALFGDGKKIADEIRKRVSEEIGVTVSVGVSFTKSFAKLGSDYKKPDATTVIMPEDVEKIVYPQSLGNLLFAGGKTCAEFAKYGINTIGDLARTDKSFITDVFGKNGIMLYNYATGNDTDAVRSIYDSEEVKSVGNSYTFPFDLRTEEEIRHALVWLGDVVSTRMRKIGQKCSVVSVVIRDENFKTITRQMTIPHPTNHGGDLTKYAMELVKKNWNLSVGVRMIGISGSNLTEGSEQTSLFEAADEKKNEKLDAAIDAVRAKFGQKAIKFASSDAYHTKYAENDEAGD
ncbi:MAG: DNA polymerase IV [Clostridia bacterium]|nr:DNA polymerase IV [Clostridia bacterium]